MQENSISMTLSEIVIVIPSSGVVYATEDNQSLRLCATVHSEHRFKCSLADLLQLQYINVLKFDVTGTKTPCVVLR